jgi:hypothetical protein
MANSPNTTQGTLNRLRGSLNWTSFPLLNVTAPFLGREGISITFEGETTVYINTMTGAVTSPEPFLKVTVEMQLLKTQSLSTQYKAQMELQSTLGECTVIADSSVFPNYVFENASIQNVRNIRFNGEDASFAVTIGGIYIINSTLWALQ